MASSYANRGRAFEELIELANRQYRSRGIATIHKVPTAWLPIRGHDGRIVTAKVEEKASPDFLGVYRGRGVAFDAKHTNTNRIRWDRVEDHQAEFLDQWETSGGISFVLVEFGDLVCYVVPWCEWREELDRWRRHGGQASAAEGELLASGRVESGRGIPLDYLAVVDRLWPWAEVS